MIVQAIGLLGDLDKDLNIYTMRVREWHGLQKKKKKEKRIKGVCSLIQTCLLSCHLISCGFRVEHEEKLLDRQRASHLMTRTAKLRHLN